jgi:glycosyltransferase involved in cell wall biosynthesis
MVQMTKDTPNKILLSVIIPINKFERDFNNIGSIIRTFKTLYLELIFILDTSEKSAHEVLEKLCQTENLINYKILKSYGRNPGSSKNMGILNAVGEWILFCDSDDSPNLEIILNHLLNIKNDIDVVIGSYETENLKTGSITQFLLNKPNLHWELISMTPGLWRWLIRRNLLSNITFPELSMGEDQCFIIRLFVKEPRIDFSQEFFYKYRIGVLGSLTSAKNKINDLEKVIKIEFLCDQMTIKYARIRNYMIIKQIFTLVLKGNLALKFKGFFYFAQIIRTTSPKEYIKIMRFMLLILGKRIVIKND